MKRRTGSFGSKLAVASSQEFMKIFGDMKSRPEICYHKDSLWEVSYLHSSLIVEIWMANLRVRSYLGH